MDAKFSCGAFCGYISFCRVPNTQQRENNAMLEKPAQTSRPIHELFVRRWSSRAFDPNRPVGREPLAALLEAARWAPSCNGDEPWRYLIWDKARDPEGWQKAYDCL